MNGTRKCIVEGCGRKHEARGYCHTHFEYVRRGSAHTDLRPVLNTKARFMAKIEVLPSGHWIWIAATASEGRYGAFQYGGRVRPAHVASWLMFRGPLPAGAQDIDHLCRKTLCVNPDHLEPKTHRENILAGDAPTAINAAKTHCKRGHAFDAANTRMMPSGGRTCRACERARWDPVTKRRLRVGERAA